MVDFLQEITLQNWDCLDLGMDNVIQGIAPFGEVLDFIKNPSHLLKLQDNVQVCH